MLAVAEIVWGSSARLNSRLLTVPRLAWYGSILFVGIIFVIVPRSCFRLFGMLVFHSYDKIPDKINSKEESIS